MVADALSKNIMNLHQQKSLERNSKLPEQIEAPLQKRCDNMDKVLEEWKLTYLGTDPIEDAKEIYAEVYKKHRHIYKEHIDKKKL